MPTGALLEQLNRSGDLYLTHTVLDGRFTLRLSTLRRSCAWRQTEGVSPDPVGRLADQRHRDLEGVSPDPAGRLADQRHRDLEGVSPDPAGRLADQRHRDLEGVSPDPAGRLDGRSVWITTSDQFTNLPIYQSTRSRSKSAG
jgi:hypothetical protein